MFGFGRKEAPIFDTPTQLANYLRQNQLVVPYPTFYYPANDQWQKRLGLIQTPRFATDTFLSFNRGNLTAELCIHNPLPKGLYALCWSGNNCSEQVRFAVIDRQSGNRLLLLDQANTQNLSLDLPFKPVLPQVLRGRAVTEALYKSVTDLKKIEISKEDLDAINRSWSRFLVENGKLLPPEATTAIHTGFS